MKLLIINPNTTQAITDLLAETARRFAAPGTTIKTATGGFGAQVIASRMEMTIGDYSALDALLLDTVAALDCLPQIALSDDAAQKVRLGNPIIVRGRDAPVEADEACVTARGKLVAIGAVEAGMFKPKRVFAG